MAESQSREETRPRNGDELLLNSLGYKQEFRREFSPVEVFGIGFSIIGLFPSITFVRFAFLLVISFSFFVILDLFLSMPFLMAALLLWCGV
jgi:hypothetical protein